MADLASQPARSDLAEFQIERPDWTLFRNADTLAQKAGARKDLLRRIVLKEIADNALDSGAGNVEIECVDADTYRVTDDGRGITGGADEIARLFSINRPLVSSKLWRLPSRGAMGNGLRVVVGAVAASDGRLCVETRGRRYDLVPADDGSTRVAAVRPIDRMVGTSVEITFGAAIPDDCSAELWALNAIVMAPFGTTYTGRPSPFWYDAGAFFELMQGAGEMPVREFVERLDGCSGSRAGQIASSYRGRSCRSLSRDEASSLLGVARYEARPVRPERLGEVGRAPYLGSAYACQRGVATIGSRAPHAEIPFVVEAWAEASARAGSGDEVSVTAYVNRTPAVASIEAWRSGGRIRLHGCGLAHNFEGPAGCYRLTINLTTPHCPVTTDGKEPDLSPFVEAIAKAVKAATRRAKGTLPKQSLALAAGTTHKGIVLANLTEGVAKASGGGQYRFNQRQLFYVLRPVVLAQTGKELGWENFCQIVTDHETESGDISGMYRDPRGTLYHPHLGEDITLGTLAVEKYARPAWTFSQILYLEKEGFFEALKAARWPERHDCALVTSKGFTTRAVRDLLDLLGDGGEPIRVFCVHDADAFGTMIYETLQEETRARGRRLVEVVNLGLDPWEALAMGLEEEEVEEGRRHKAVAAYVTDREDGEGWADWLQTRRVELNEMTTPKLIEWLDAKMAKHGAGKVVPPETVIANQAAVALDGYVTKAVTDRVLREAGIPDQVAAIIDKVALPTPAALREHVVDWLGMNDKEPWLDALGEVIQDAVAGVTQ